MFPFLFRYTYSWRHRRQIFKLDRYHHGMWKDPATFHKKLTLHNSDHLLVVVFTLERDEYQKNESSIYWMQTTLMLFKGKRKRTFFRDTFAINQKLYQSIVLFIYQLKDPATQNVQNSHQQKPLTKQINRTKLTEAVRTLNDCRQSITLVGLFFHTKPLI